MPAARTFVAAFAAILVAVPVQAARPIVDLHKLDAYFALFAADSNPPWKPTSVRLDTYSSAPVRFAVYRVDPADVLTAGSNARARAIDTRHRKPIARFTYTPPGGYEFQPNDVTIPLRSQEGFFVVEARRGSVGEQVWINRSRIALIAKQTPGELFLYGTDLGSGAPLEGMRVQLLVGDRFVTEYTGNDGTLRWHGDDRPDFVLAQWGSSFAFLSLLPQAPVPPVVVGVRTESAVVHGGDDVHAIGFARVRRGDAFAPASGTALVLLRQGARILAQERVRVEHSGAFTATLAVPSDASAGDDAVLAEVDGGVGGASVHVDADAGGLTLDVASACGDSCDPGADVPVVIRSSRGGCEVNVAVIRSPHVYVGYAPDSTPWGTTVWFRDRVVTDANGRAAFLIPHPTDALGSTYGVRVESGGATADTRIVVPTAPVAVAVRVDSDEEQLGMPVGFTVTGIGVRDGRPAVGADVTVTLSHGGSTQRKSLVLDVFGRARGEFANADLGTNLVTATLVRDGELAEDATELEVVAQATSDRVQSNSVGVSIRLDAESYRPGEVVHVDAIAPGTSGDALVTLVGSFGVESTVARVRDGRASAELNVRSAPGALRVGATFVHDGAIESSSVPLDVAASGRAGFASIAMPASLAPGTDVTLALRGAPAVRGTIVVRLTNEQASGSALFDSAPSLLGFGVSTTQTSAPQSATWHPWVDSTGKHPLVLEFVRHTEPPPDLRIEEAATTALSWSVVESDGHALALALPSTPGRYVLSVLDITDDGRVIAASSPLDVP
ncbi:MAG: hypothetical protein ACREMP_03225 [Candidatus Tyrphobacter sp.]